MSAVALTPGMAALILFGAFFVLIVLRVPVSDREPLAWIVREGRRVFRDPAVHDVRLLPQ